MIDKQQPSGQEVAYLRVSTRDQNLDRQQEMADRADKAFPEKESAKDRKGRPELRRAIDYCRDGDTLVVWSVDRLARSIRDLSAIIDELHAKGVSVRFEKDGLTFAPGERATASQKLQLNILGVFAEFERDISRERQAEGIIEAKKKGVYKNRKKSWALTAEQIEAARNRIALKVPVAVVARDLGVSRPTLYRALNDESYGSQPNAAAIDAALRADESEYRQEVNERLEAEMARVDQEYGLVDAREKSDA